MIVYIYVNQIFIIMYVIYLIVYNGILSLVIPAPHEYSKPLNCVADTEGRRGLAPPALKCSGESMSRKQAPRYSNL